MQSIFGSRDKCPNCGCFRSKALNSAVKPGDWKCQLCSYMNFAKNGSCKRCLGSPVPLAAQPEPLVHSVPSVENDVTCCVCMDRPLEAFLKNCKHICMCMVCSMTQDKCPKCRVPYNPDDVDKVFIG